MLRKGIRLFKSSQIFSRIKFSFCRNGAQPQQEMKSLRRLKVSLLENKLIMHIRRINQTTMQVEESKIDYFDAQNSNAKNGSIQFDKIVIPDTRTLMILAACSFLIALWKIDKQNNSTQRQEQRGGMIVSENEMIARLANGGYNQHIYITRILNRTQCLIKEKDKRAVPIRCIVSDLSAFLTALQKIPITYEVHFNYSQIFAPMDKSTLLMDALIFGSLIYMILRSKKIDFGKAAGSGLDQLLNTKKFEAIKPENIKTYFKDVAGMHQAKQEITEFVDFLKTPDKYLEMGAKIPKGALLTGPPGTGKTLLARACAGEAGVPFFYVSGSQFVEKYVGMGANRVRKLFEAAAKQAPSIIFIDQIDAIGKKRNSGPFANEEKENTLNQLLVNMDGFDSKNKIIVMAATNIKDSLDPALLRPGRFDRAIQIGLPNFQERQEILKVHLTKVKFSSKFSIQEFAKKIAIMTPGFSGAELANICNEAAILAARADKSDIGLQQFEKATQRVMAGLEKRNLFSQEQKECLAYYECGKAVVSWFTEGADPVIKISITPYSKSGAGYSHELKSEIPLKTEAQLMNKVICYLAGRTSEQLFKGYITSNGDADLKKAKRIVSFLVVKFGMSNIGKIAFPDIEYVRKPYSDETEKRIDNQIQKIFKSCQDKAETLVKQKKELIEKLKAVILEKQTLSHNSIKEILGERPFSDHEGYQKFSRQKEKEVIRSQVTPDSVQPQ